MNDEFYLVGSGRNSDGVPIYVALRYADPAKPVIVVQVDCGPASENWELAPDKAIAFAPTTARFVNTDDQVRFAGMEQQPADWFQHRCAETNCEWFVSIVRRMAVSEVPLEKIQNEYFTHNSKPMPRGKWSELSST